MCKILSDPTDPYQYEVAQGTPKMGKILWKKTMQDRKNGGDIGTYKDSSAETLNILFLLLLFRF